jgi:Ca2+-binding EF-hand superfamily protein
MGREKKNDQYAGISTFPGQTQFQDPKKSYEQSLSRQIFNDFRDRLFSRGVRGYFGLLKHLKSIDEKNSGTVDFETFFKTTQDFRFDHNDQELQRLLSYAEAFEDGCVKYLVLLEKLVGNLNEYRRKTVNQFFDRLDKDFKGYLTTDTLYSK